MRVGSFLLPLGVLGLVSCADLSPGPQDTGANMNRYVAMGTSVSMGVASDGVTAASQQTSWPALLAADVGAEFGLPLIDAPGCTPPLVAPLQGLRRADNSLITEVTTCSANVAGFNLPEQNVAITGATAQNAVGTTPAGSSRPIYSRVLRDGQTQVSAMRSMSPTFVSVEFGASDLLPALNGLATDATSLGGFASSYSSIITSLGQTTAQAILVLLPTDVRDFPGLRTAAEIGLQRAAFATRNVSVNANCDASPNHVSLQYRIVPVLATGAARAAAGQGPADLSCADVAGGRDGILSPAEVTTLNALAVQMNAHITGRATAGGFATFSLGALYDTVKDGIAFDLNSVLTSPTPFGPLISLDGVHPTAAGQAVLASAAKAAIIQTYGNISP